jgi:hypothetical protein
MGEMLRKFGFTYLLDASDDGGSGGGEGEGGLLDQEAEGDDDGSSENEGDGGEEDRSGESDSGDGEGDQTAGAVDVDQVIDKVTERLAERFDSIADRRVNALLKEIRKQEPEGKDDTDEKDESKGTETGSSTGLLRGGRLAFKEYLTDEVKFLGAEEREMAIDLGNREVAALAASGIEDEDRIGREAAKTVADRVKKTRKFYEDRTIRALKRKGRLIEEDKQPNKGGSGTSAISEFERGQKMADERFAKNK